MHFSFLYLVDKGRFEADKQCSPVVAVAAVVDGKVLLGHLEGDPSQAKAWDHVPGHSQVQVATGIHGYSLTHSLTLYESSKIYPHVNS